MKKLLVILSVLLLVFSCHPETVTPSDYDVSGIVLAKDYSVVAGNLFKLSFLDGKGPVEGDQVRLVSADQTVRHTVKIQEVTQDSFSFRIPSGMTSGDYTLWILHENAGHKVGTAHFDVTVEIVPETESSVYGIVSCEGKGVSGVIVTDGVSFAETDESGAYQFSTSKKDGFVYITKPAGYDIPVEGARASFFHYFTKPAGEAEQVDFELIPSDGRPVSILVLGDIHLAGINNDRSLFAKGMKDMKSYVSSRPDRRFYALTLGDLSWDSYWYSNDYDLRKYVSDLNTYAPDGVPFFNTVGNHDHDQNAVGDILSIRPYHSIIGPTNYSFDVGNYHVVVLDDIECTNSQASTITGDYRSCNVNVVPEVLQWLKGDLSYVPKTKIIIAAMHGNLYAPVAESSVTAYKQIMDNLNELLACFKGRTVHFLTGHTHNKFNVDKLSVSANAHFEHNNGALCAAWWQTEKLSGNSLSKDGSPGGYAVFDMDEDGLYWQYKAVEKDIAYQFRSFDLNNVNLTTDKYIPGCTVDSYKEQWENYTSDSSPATTVSFRGNASNTVLINVWDWDPGWKIKVTENGKALSVSRIRSYDPLFIISYVAVRFGNNKSCTCPPQWSNHMFKVKASSATSTLLITVTDRFGRTYTEEMQRPKVFSTDAY